eukprot:179732-Prymnesium_polylepis.1
MKPPATSRSSKLSLRSESVASIHGVSGREMLSFWRSEASISAASKHAHTPRLSPMSLTFATRRSCQILEISPSRGRARSIALNTAAMRALSSFCS